jgi:hypothetical protein
MISIISTIRSLSQRVGRNLHMNRFERQPQSAVEAEVEYRDGDYRVRRPGAFVRCAVTGEPIALEELRYWNVDLQEAYSSPQAKLMRLGVKRPG